MTMTDGWDDARLSSAYTAMTVARPTPAGLEARTLSALRATTTGPRPHDTALARLLPAILSLGAVAIALILAVTSGGLPHDGVAVPSAAAPTALGRSGAPSTAASTGAAPSGAPTILGLPVISVPELIARRTRGEAPSPEEVAVRGWILRSNVVFDCAVPDIEPHPLVPRCLAPTLLMERPERPTELTTDGPSVTPLLGPDVHIEGNIGYQDPVEVIAIGHFGDHRWTTCQPAEQDACRRVFVADRIVPADASLEGLPEPWRIPRSSSTEPHSDPEDVVSRLEVLLGDITVVSMGHVAAGLLREIEPAVVDRGDIDSATQLHPVWVARALVEADPEPGVPRTFIVADRPVEEPELPMWDASEDGVAPMPEPERSLRWIPRGAVVVELPFEDGPGRPPVVVAVIDQTGQLGNARAAITREPALRDITMNAVSTDDLPDGGVIVQWAGSMCDDRLTVTISASDAGAPDRVTVDGRRGSPCRLMLMYYAVVLSFDPAVRAEDLAGQYLIGP